MRVRMEQSPFLGGRWQCTMVLAVILFKYRSTLLESPKSHLNSNKVNSSSSEQSGPHFAEDIFRCIFVNETFCIWIKISVKFVPKGPIDDN